MLLNKPRAHAVMEKHGLDALVACTPPNFHYIAGWHSDSHLWGGGDFAILPQNENAPCVTIIANTELGLPGTDPEWKPEIRTFGKELHFAAPPGYEPSPAEVRWLANYEQGRKKNWTDRIQALGDTIVELGLSRARLGFDDMRIAPALRDRGFFTGEDVDAVAAFREIRLVKTPAEIEILRRGNEINLAAMMDVVSAIKEGATWNDALIAHDVRLAKEGVLRTVGVRISRIGKMSIAMFHPKDFAGYVPRKGDLVRFDFEGIYEGYWTDLGRSFVVGEPSDEQVKVYKALVEARNEVFDAARPGVHAADLCQLALQTIEGSRQRSRVGSEGRQMAWTHAIGLELYEAWCWWPQGDFVLEEGMVFNYETPYARMGWGGLQIEDTFLVSRNGAIDLSPMKRDLIGI